MTEHGAADSAFAPRVDGAAEVRAFLDEHTAKLRALLLRAHANYWEAATSGDPGAAERYAKADAEVKKLHSNPEAAGRVRRWLTEETVADPILRRQLVLLDHQFTGNQLPPETIEDLSTRAAELERVFNTFRARIDGAQVSDNQIREILRTERDNDGRRAAWEASKQVAQEVAEPLRELVRRRNAAARFLGFPDFYVMSLKLQEQDEEHLFTLLESFRAASEQPFRVLRAEIDGTLARRFGVLREELRPWHWEDPFAQEAPSTGEVDLDAYFGGVDLVQLATRYFAVIGLPVDDIIERSDLWEREGKSQHAFCIDLDREGDVRILCNLRQTEHWAMVLLHELGHAIYDKYLPAELPFLLRGPAHTLSTEAIAMLMGRLTRDPRWLSETVGAELSAEDRQDIARQLRTRMLVAARWMLVMVFFERELYRNPDRADLNSLWWDLVERFQLIRRPAARDEPDWAAKIHLSGAPVYYHNYLLGEWMTSHLTAHLDMELGDGALAGGDPKVGEYLKQRLFRHGATRDWNSVLVESTGEGLNPDYFVRQFVRS
jgi:peptidyl-dipeptidase A